MALSFHSTLKKPKVEIIDLTFQKWCMQESQPESPYVKGKPLVLPQEKLIKMYTYIHIYIYIHTYTYGLHV